MSMRTIALDSSMAHQWNQIVFNSEDSWIYHLYDWIFLTEQHWPLESKSFLLEYEGKIVGIVPLQLNKTSKSLKSTYMGLGGVALLKGLQDGVRKKIFKFAYECIKKIAEESKSPYIEIYLSSLSESSLQSRWHVNPLLYYYYEDISTNTLIIDLTSSEENIFKKYSDDAKRSIKKAMASGYKIEAVTQLSEIDRFYEVHCENRKRTGAETHPKEFFINFYQDFCQKGLAVIWQAKNLEGDAIAFEVTGFFKNSANYWMGCCVSEHLDSGVNYLLQHHSIMWAKSKGACWFENGEAFPNVQEGKLHGLTLFKGKFGGQLHRLYKGRISLQKERNKENLYTKVVRKVFRVLPQPLVRFLYIIYKSIRLRNRISFIKPYWGVREVLSGFLYSDQNRPDYIKRLIQKFQTIFNIKGVLVPTSSGRTALELALNVLKKKDSSKTKVIIPTYSCQGLFNPIISAGLTPLLVDIGEDLNMTTDSIKNVIQSHEDILAIVVVHLGGSPCNIQEIVKLVKSEQIFVIEDVCQALGAKNNNGFLGTNYDMAIFSFALGKNLMATAGGLLVANILQTEVIEESKSLKVENTDLVKQRHRNIVFKYFLRLNKENNIHPTTAFEYNRMHPLDAHLMLMQLDRIQIILEKRKKNARKFLEVLSNTKIKFIAQNNTENVFTKLSITCLEQEYYNQLINALDERNIETEDMYTPLHLRNLEKKFLRDQNLLYSQKIYRNVVNIPVRPNLSRRDLNRIVKAIESLK